MPDNAVSVKVLLNQDGGFLSYSPGDRLHEALAFDCPMPACGHLEMLLEIIWEQLNVDHPRAEWAIRYRAERNRSLSMGDVVVLGETAWTPVTVGWSRVVIQDKEV